MFQHIQPKEGYALFEEIVSKSSDRAVLTVCLPFWCEANAGASQNILSRLATGYIRLLARYGKQPAEKLVQMHTYDLSRILKIMNAYGYGDVFLKHENHGGFHGAWIIARNFELEEKK
ncbi:MAG: hypothetical protein AAGH42_13120 [Pseudomonadota bacterium]